MRVFRQILGLFAIVLMAGAIGFYFGRQSKPALFAQKSRPAQAPSIEIARDSLPTVATAPTTESVSSDALIHLSLPIKGLSASDLHDTFDEVHGEAGRKHEATDIMAPRGTPVLAVNDGKIVKLFLSKPGGNTVYQFDPSEKYCFYYAHLDHYADGLAEGAIVRRGDTIGFVGSTGNADPSSPHLHFEIHRLGAEKRWWIGTPINPYQYLRNALPSA
jgi:murein DD-endopeptidase MepM/ murein hydrolase activator NlpD